jgi:hypothetical protein
MRPFWMVWGTLVGIKDQLRLGFGTTCQEPSNNYIKRLQGHEGIAFRETKTITPDLNVRIPKLWNSIDYNTVSKGEASW